MKRSKKITIAIIIFFLVIALVIIGRYAVGIYFKKKFSKRPPPGVIVEVVVNKSFTESLESYCTSLSSKTLSYKIKKNELLKPINFNSIVNKGDVIAKLSAKTIIAPFAGVIGKRGISGSSLGSENTIILTLDGIKFLRAAIIEFDDASTNRRANVMAIAFSTFTVTANAEQIPKTCFVIGLLSIKGSDKINFVCLSILFIVFFH